MSAWRLFSRAVKRVEAGDLPAARGLLLEAVALDRNPALKQSLARVCEQLGFIAEARAWAGRAGDHAMLGLLWGRQRRYAKSAREYARALRRSPGDPDLALALSQAVALQGDLRRARRLAPPSPWKERLDALFGEPRGPFARGYQQLSLGRWREAAREFSRLGDRRSRFYLTAARMLAGPRPKAKLLMIGLGVDPPYSATAEALRALSACDVLFDNISGTETAELLWPLCRDVRPIFSEDERLESLAELMLDEVRQGKRVGFVTRGSALVFGELGERLAERCGAEGLSWSCLPALSTADLFDARYGGPSLGGGILSASAELEGKRLEPLVPWTVFVPRSVSAARFTRLCRLLAAQLGARRPVLVFDHKVAQAPIRTTLGKLPSVHPRLSPAAVFRVSGPVAARKGGALLAGLGPRPSEHATIETLEALGRVATIYARGLDAGSLRFLKRFTGARFVRAPERAAAIVTPHHPFRLGFGRGLALPALSAESVACAAAGLALSGGSALQSFSEECLARGKARPEPSWPRVSYSRDCRRIALKVPGG